MSLIKVSVVGVGSIGSRYVEWLSELNYSVSAFDIDMNNLSSLKPNIKKFFNLKDLTKWRPDYIIIATPPDCHLETFIKLIDCSAHFLIEKPLAANIKDAKEICKISQNFNNKIHVVSNMRFHPAVISLRSKIKDIGRIIFAHGHFSHRLAQMRPKGLSVFATDSIRGGGVIMDCVHDIDLLFWLVGDLNLVHSWVGQIGPDKINAEDYAVLHLTNKTETRVTLHLDFISSWKQRGLKLVGDKSSLKWDSQGRDPELASVSLFLQNQKKEILNEIKVDPKISYIQMLKSFLGNKKNLQTPFEALQVLEIAINAVNK